MFETETGTGQRSKHTGSRIYLLREEIVSLVLKAQDKNQLM
jgi:hypothetical protein